MDFSFFNDVSRFLLLERFDDERRIGEFVWVVAVDSIETIVDPPLSSSVNFGFFKLVSSSRFR
jgi:hypothetical protein